MDPRILAQGIVRIHGPETDKVWPQRWEATYQVSRLDLRLLDVIYDWLKKGNRDEQFVEFEVDYTPDGEIIVLAMTKHDFLRKRSASGRGSSGQE